MDNNYTNFTVEDFVADESFIDWVTKNSQDEKWQQFITNNSGKLSETINEARSVVMQLHSSGVKNIPVELQTKIWGNIQSRISNRTSIYRRIAYIATSAAACLALFFFIKNFQSNKSLDTVVSNTTEDTKEMVLPDNSYVYLDKNASIKYLDSKFKANREIELNGQAFFEVEKGKDFIVHANDGFVKVLGTSFNVEDESNNLVVTCYTGKVIVHYKKDHVILHPGEKSDFNHPSLKTKIITEGTTPLWVAGTFTFENIELKTILDKVGAHYKVNINIDSELLKNQKYTGTVVKNDIESALKSITWPLHLSYSLEGDDVLIEKK